MQEPEWVLKSIVLALQDEQLAEHGGSPGLRDEGLLESALARPLNLFTCGAPDLADLAAAYAFGLAKNHPFIDGNKRASYVTTRLFLMLNGAHLAADPAERVRIWLAIAAGHMTEEQIAAWVREHMI
ncbi:MAG: type II toxin-antitoxin system death-on-curing family toxin [Beijerinckiaceae bacterium]